MSNISRATPTDVEVASSALPTGAATATNQTLGNASLAGIYTEVARELTLTNRSGTITTGGTAQSAAASNSARRYLQIQNPSANTESIWYSLITTAVEDSPSIELLPGDMLILDNGVGTGAVSVIAATTSTAFTIWEGE